MTTCGLTRDIRGERSVNSGRGQSIVHLFEQQVERTPDNVAIISDDEALTYRELDRQANQLGHYLRKRGITAEGPVGLFMERSTRMLVALLATLKAGGVHVPLDPALPRERLTYLLLDSGMNLLLTDSQSLDRLHSQSLAVNLDQESDLIAAESVEPLDLDLDPERLAYIIYTSGSTGKPKGVALPHRVFMRCSYWARDVFQFSPDDRFLLKTTRSPEELLYPLLIGAPVVVAPPHAERDAALFVRTIFKHEITVVSLSPSLLSLLLNEPAFQHCLGLKHVLCSGEILPNDLRRRFFERSGANLYNFYGLAEAPYTAIWPCRGGDNRNYVPVGRPVDARIYLLDSGLQPVPHGQVGELYIGGPGLARGYLNMPELTSARFIANGWPNKARIYKTGDRAYYDKEDALVVLGRTDFQIKVRGFRVEPEEVELALQSHPLVRAAAAIVIFDPPREPDLTGYLVLEANATITVQTLRNFLKEKLPEYAIPSRFVVVSKLPMTSTGKVDRPALKREMGSELAAGTSYVAPRDEYEREVIKIWQDVLCRNGIGIYDNFFDLGGHSLSATQVMARIRSTMGVELPLRELFEAATVVDLAGRLRNVRPVNEQVFTRAPRLEPVELSFAQERLWFLDQLEPDGRAYHIPEAYLLNGPLDPVALERSIQVVGQRHELLRTSLQVVDGRPVQIIAPGNCLKMSFVDASGLPEPEQDGAIERQIAKNSALVFDLAKGPLLQTTLVRLAPERHLLLFNMHHVVSDDWSLGVLCRELSALYAEFVTGAPANLPDLPIQYADYAICQRKWLQGNELERQLGYWRERLEESPTIALPTDFPRPPKQTYVGARHPFKLPPEITARLKSFNRKHHTTPFMTLLAAFQVLLSRYSGQFDILVGTPIANRTHLELERLIGFFVNTLVLRTDLAGDPGFEEIVRRVRRNALDAYQNQDFPFEKVVESLNPERDLSRPPLFQVMFALQDVPIHPLALPAIEVSKQVLPINSAHFDLELFMATEGESWLGFFGYNTDLFTAETIERMTGHYLALLESMLAYPDRPISKATMLTAAERQQVLVDWNRTGSDYSRNGCIHRLFEQQVEQTPETVAVVCNEQQFTYAELNARANRLADYLRKLGVKTETLVGVCVDRSADMIVALLGVLKAGGAYVPIDPAYPKARVAFILEDADVTVLVTQRRWLSLLPEATIVTLDDLPWSNIGNVPDDVEPHNLAYIIYTSGSTGQPKGVAIEHRNALALIDWAARTFTTEELSGVLGATSICFDLSIFELFVPLACGGTVILAENILQLPDLSARNRIRLINTVPSGIRELIRSGKIPPSVITVNLAGEPLDSSLVQELYAIVSIQKVYDLYGPSEDTTYTTCALRGPDGRATIGRPIPNKQTYILDEKQHPVPVGVPGELYIGGDGLARGYLNRPELTAEKFIPNPFNANRGARLYRTGDRCRYLADGNIEFLGRIDNQVKVRGFRIELGEIEAVLGQHPAVEQCVVVARENQPGDNRLIAHIVPANPALELPAAELKSFLRDRLPDYMIPAAVVTLDRLPVTPNGKIDHKSLPAVAYGTLKTPSLSVPRNSVERQLVGIWQNVLGIESFDLSDNFFELGGHSLLAARLMGEIIKVFQVQLPLATIFRAPTVESLALAISEHAGPQPPGLIVPRIKRGRTNIFWAPSIGTVERYGECYHLARVLEADCSFYGFDPAPEFDDFDRLVRHCIRLIRTEQADGPYAVAGFCQAGHMAYEIARQMQSDGHDIALLAIIDCSARVFAPTFRQKLYWLRDGFRGDLRTVLTRARSAGRRRIPGVNGDYRPMTEEPNIQFAAHAEAAGRHRTKAFDGNIVLFRSEESLRAQPHSPRLGWDALARSVDVHRVCSAHSAMLAESAPLRFIAEKFISYLSGS
ncbi:MAG TPA: amino acid adenylation domain-containing protein [Chthoniobacterales bacterium]